MACEITNLLVKSLVCTFSTIYCVMYLWMDENYYITEVLVLVKNFDFLVDQCVAKQNIDIWGVPFGGTHVGCQFTFQRTCSFKIIVLFHV